MICSISNVAGPRTHKASGLRSRGTSAHQIRLLLVTNSRYCSRREIWWTQHVSTFVQAFSSATTVSSRMQLLMSKGQAWASLKRTRAPEQKREACELNGRVVMIVVLVLGFELGSFLSTVRRSTSPLDLALARCCQCVIVL